MHHLFAPSAYIASATANSSFAKIALRDGGARKLLTAPDERGVKVIQPRERIGVIFINDLNAF
jgi:hypothetical protein